MKQKNSPLILYIGFHVTIPILILLAIPLRSLLQNAPPILSNCWIHDLLHLYCPLCGGTRSVSAMIRLDFLEALRYNAAVVILFVLFLIGDLVLLLRLLRKKEKWWSIPSWCWIGATVFLLGYTILRNLLMVVWGIDPTGDLALFW